MKDKFYVAASKIQDGNCHTGWRRPTLQSAVEHAQELMESDNSHEKYIVKIVAVVKREKPPIKVVRVK